jgi:NAD(P)-dependent dehydrogenase (short-subunit alcohol dehydrogenase family)
MKGKHMRFKDKVVIITGAGKGIGKAIALDFAKEGAKTVILSRTEKDIISVFNEINKMNMECLPLVADVSREEDVLKVYSETLNKFNTVDILINNAAVQFRTKIVDSTLEEWNFTLNVNLTGAFLFCREALKIMIKNNYGKIINISSDAGKTAFAELGAYSASKFGLAGLTEAIAKEVADYNINVNAVCPASVDTELTRRMHMHMDYSKIKVMKSEDISKIVLFLASEDSRVMKAVSLEAYDGQNFVDDIYGVQE